MRAITSVWQGVVFRPAILVLLVGVLLTSVGCPTKPGPRTLDGLSVTSVTDKDNSLATVLQDPKTGNSMSVFGEKDANGNLTQLDAIALAAKSGAWGKIYRGEDGLPARMVTNDGWTIIFVNYRDGLVDITLIAPDGTEHFAPGGSTEEIGDDIEAALSGAKIAWYDVAAQVRIANAVAHIAHYCYRAARTATNVTVMAAVIQAIPENSALMAGMDLIAERTAQEIAAVVAAVNLAALEARLAFGAELTHAIVAAQAVPQPSYPVVWFFALNGGASVTADRSISLINAYSNYPTQYMASESIGFEDAVWTTYAVQVDFTLSAGNGLKTVYFKVRNATDESSVIAGSIELHEPQAPGITGFAINNGAATTTIANVTLDNTCAEFPTEFLASESSSFTGATWKTYELAPLFTLSAGTGMKTVYFKARNAQGESPVVSDLIQRIIPPTPEVTAFAINNDAETTSSRTVTLNNTCTNGPVDYMASESASFSGASWFAYSTSPSFTLSAGDGAKTAYFKTRNANGQSNVMSDTITLNQPPAPTVTSFSINSGTAESASRVVILNNICTGSPTHYMASESSGFTGAAWQTYSTSPSFMLSSGNVTKTVYFKVKNAAGDSAAVSDTITLNENTGTEESIMLPGNVPLVMVWCPAGTFMMGGYPGEQGSHPAEDPQHQVAVPGFWMGKYELTQAQWQAVMGTTPSYFVGANRPVEQVSWNSVKSFITALNSYTGLTFRLPSEAEWEYAARAGTSTRFYWGDDPDYTQMSSYAWSDNSGSQTHDVGGRLPNAWGLYDMSGNVWEWCEDDWHWDYTGAPTNGSAWVDSPRYSYRVFRGGSWSDLSVGCRSALRGSYIPSGAYSDFGLRLSR